MVETKTKILHYKNLPLSSPLNTGLLWWIALEYFHATPVVWGVVGTFFALYVFVWINQRLTTDFTEL